jgi:hypothetical protein
LCLSSSSALHFFWFLFSCPPPCQPGWPASSCTCNGLWLQSHVAVFSKIRIVFSLRIKLYAVQVTNAHLYVTACKKIGDPFCYSIVSLMASRRV